MFAIPGREIRKTKLISRVADRLVMLGIAAGSMMAVLGLSTTARADTALPVETIEAAMLAQMLVAPQTTIEAPTMAVMTGMLVAMLLASAAFAASLKTDYAISRRG